ncbi:MAG: cell division protein FtsA [Rhodospirillaceae bacterium]|nr:MAG: cell division protein FtsA [Rhodospirillaceae bacterium]
MPPKIKLRTGLIAALDVGTTKVCCFIARAEEDVLKVVGIGHQRSLGLRNGVVIDMDEVEASIRAAVAAAEQMAGERINRVVVNVSGGRPHSSKIEVEVSVDGRQIDDDDVRRIVDYARRQKMTGDHDLIHCISVGYSIDGANGIRDPRGMFGNRLGVSLHMVAAQAGAVRNLRLVVERCHLDVEAMVVSPYASGLACLVDDEKELGVTAIDMGGGITAVGVFENGQVIHVACLPIGGQHVTGDIAKGLSTPVANAERLKTLYGSAMPSPSDAREILKVPLVGEDDESAANQVPRSMLVQIIQPRIEETFELVRSHLEANGLARNAGRLVVLTGGAAQLQGVREAAALILDKQVRLGRPAVGLRGLAEATGGPEFATCAGLLKYATHIHGDTPARQTPSKATNRFGWLGEWLRTNF